jgi:hypothetical protein
VINKFELIPEEELLRRLKKTRLQGFGQPFIYESSELNIVAAVEPRTLAPAQRFVLTSGVEAIRRLAEDFERHGIDIFGLRGGILFRTDDAEDEQDAIPFIPPVIEESVEPDGRTVWLINDGIHRVYAAMKLGRKLNIVLAQNVPLEYPYYAYALPNGWADVTELAELPDGFQKKTYRDPKGYKALFRDFNEILPGVQKQRKQTNPAHLKP